MKIEKMNMSLSEFSALAKTQFSEEQRSRDLGHESFFGVSFDQAVEYFEKGYISNTDKMLLDIDSLVSLARESFADEYQFDVTGEFFDIGRVVSGEPEVWLYRPIEEKPELDLIIDFGYNCNIKQDQIYNRGVAVLSFIRLASEKFNLRIELANKVLPMRDSALSSSMTFSFIIPNDPLDLDLMNYLLTHKGAFRRLGISVLENLSGIENVSSETTATELSETRENSIYFPLIKRDEYKTLEESKERVVKLLQDKLGA
uniref:DUF7192 domain-containing protein n=2 Tax=viral metagenome TaxID=1070528 RepID=A0A6H2A1U0_9ZZZZ